MLPDLMSGNLPTIAFWTPGPWELALVLIVALVIFGRRLPEVGRSLGQGLVEFKKGLKGVKDEMDSVDDDVNRAARDAAEPGKLDQSDDVASQSSTKTESKSHA